MREIAQLDEPAMFALGFDRVTVKAFSAVINAVKTTLPETVAQVESTGVKVEGLEADSMDAAIVPNTVLRALAEIAAELVPQPSGMAGLLRRLDEMSAGMESLALANQQLARRVAELENGVN